MGQPIPVYRQRVAPAHLPGRVWVDTSDDSVYRSDGIAWIKVADVTGDAIGDIIVRQSDQPASPVKGMLWIDTDDSKIYRYNGSTWDFVAALDALLLTNGPAEAGATTPTVSGSVSYDNLIRNPGFEVGDIGSALDPHNYDDGSGGTWAANTNAPRSGGRAAMFTVGSQTSTARIFFNGPSSTKSSHVPVHEGDLIYFECYVRSGGTGTVPTVFVSISWRDKDGNAISSTSSSAVAPSSSYAKRYVSGVAPAGVAYAVASVQINTGGGSSRLILVDDAYMRRAVGTEIGTGLSVGGLISAFDVVPIQNSVDAGASATINMRTSVLTIGDRTVSYPSGSIAGLSFGTKYHVYRDDPALDGSGSYVATTSLTTAVGAEGRVYFGSITTVNDGGGGGGVVNPGQCVATDQWIGEKQAADVKPGDQVLCLDGDGYAPYPIESVEFSEQPCVELVTASGVRLVCSTSTPLTLRSGMVISVLSASPGAEVPVLDAQGFRWEPLAAIQPAPPRRVAHIHVGGRTYAAGSEPGRFILTHNPVKP